MADKYEHHRNIHNPKSIFLPMFCRLSIKEVKLNGHRKIHAGAGEPSSPKVSCMGQVKRNPTAAAGHHKHTTPNRNKPGKALLPSTGGGAPIPGGGRISQEMNRAARISRRSRVTIDFDRDGAVDVSKMDPPLPVVRRAAPPPGAGREEVNLWRRRFDGAGGGLKRLEIEKIRLPGGGFQPPASLTV
ncbi:mitochondrial inner membrane translocase complex [Striga asiatica]|uniref:Mitochondrial inner membrane translocase complex n=1 Tax=Striga asiatica TaxID=4170 RepID=A0A5A7PYQ5_STRAF|nr:mitochondrial inner membrane translocase complex [Striga asiatica]